MNYDHAFHAGNFADVLKHAVLTRILVHLARKPAAFRVIDTHAGAGLYDLAGEAARRTGEAREGVARLRDLDAGSPAGALLAPYRALLADATRTPGSPVIAQALLRPQDRALFCETQPRVRAQLAAALGRDARVKVLDLDGWTALKACVPPPERRGMVLIDPPFEAPDDFARLASGAATILAKWRAAIVALWYPVKAPAARDAFLADLRARVSVPMVRIELGVAPVRPDARLARAGLVVCNPPWMLADEMGTILPALAPLLAREGAGPPLWSLDAA